MRFALQAFIGGLTQVQHPVIFQQLLERLLEQELNHVL